MQFNTVSFKGASFSNDRITEKSIAIFKEKHPEQYENLLENLNALEKYSEFGNQDVKVKLNSLKEDQFELSADIDYKSGSRKAKIKDEDIKVTAQDNPKSINAARKTFVVNCLSAIQTNHLFEDVPEEDSTVNGYRFAIEL